MTISAPAAVLPLLARVASWLPHGAPLPPQVWAARHRWVVVLLALQAAVIPMFAATHGYPWCTESRKPWSRPGWRRWPAGHGWAPACAARRPVPA